MFSHVDLSRYDLMIVMWLWCVDGLGRWLQCPPPPGTVFCCCRGVYATVMLQCPFKTILFWMPVCGLKWQSAAVHVFAHSPDGPNCTKAQQCTSLGHQLHTCWVWHQPDYRSRTNAGTERQTERMTDKQNDRQADRQTERMTDRETDRPTERPGEQK